MLFDRCSSGLAADVGVWIGSTVRFAERVSAGDQSYRFLVVHCHTTERLADIACSSQGIRVAVRTFRVNVDETHLHGSERTFKFTVSRVTLVGKPLLLRAPIHVLLGFPDVFTSTGEAEGFEAH